MKTTRKYFIALLFCLAPAGAFAQGNAAPTVPAKYAEYTRQATAAEASPPAGRAAAVDAAYAKLLKAEFNASQLKRASPEELNYLSHAADKAAMYSHQESYGKDMLLVFREQEARKLADDTLYRKMYDVLYSVRLLGDANKLLNENPDHFKGFSLAYRSAPVVAQNAPTEWIVDPYANAVRRQTAVFPEGWYVVVVSHPLNSASQRAIHDIAADSTLGAALRNHVKWLVPQDRQTDLKVLQDWNADHPDNIMTVVFREREWPLIDNWDTPTFYIIKEGKVAAKIAGWSKDGSQEKLRDALKQIGALPAK
ncbi:MAG: hypothetical protein ABI905_01530 [Betaproteobacteria bacterium]